MDEEEMHFARPQYEEGRGLQEEIEIVVVIVKEEVEYQEEEEEECTFNIFNNMKMEED